MKKLYFFILVFSLAACTHIFAQAPVVSSFSPSSGGIGTAVTITGSGFDSAPGNNVVYFGATRATVTAATSTELKVTAPASGTYQYITVTNTATNLTAYSKSQFIYTYPSKGTIQISATTATDFDAKFDVSPVVDPNIGIKNPLWVAFADLDGDGKPDMITTSGGSTNTSAPYGFTISIILNNFTKGSGFSASSLGTKIKLPGSTATAGSTGLYGVATGDLDGDGKPDMVVSNNLNGTISVFKNMSTGVGNISFTQVGTDITVTATPRTVLIQDIDNDGKPDVLVDCYGGNKICILPNTTTAGGTISFGTRVDLGTPSGPDYLAAADLDGDGKVDLVTSNSSGSMSIYRNTSTASGITFDTRISFITNPAGTSPTTAYALGVGDMDGDGKTDIVTGTWASSGTPTNALLIYRNTTTVNAAFSATSSFAAPVAINTGNSTYNVALGDLDGDGKPDIVTTNRNENTVSIAQNTTASAGNISFSFIGSFAVSTTPQVVAICDLDGDGLSDIAVANQGGTTVSLIHNNPSPFITVSSGTTTFTSGVTVSPVNVDGSLALYDKKGTLVSGTVAITRNFSSAQDVLAFTNASATTMGDIAGSYTIATGVLSLTSASGTATAAQWQAALRAVTYVNNSTTAPANLTRTITFSVNDGTTASASFTKTININVINATLSGLALSAGTLSPVFAPGTDTYTASVPNTTTSITVTPTVSDASSTVTVNGTAVTSGNASTAITLSPGDNTITTVVTAHDGATTKTYTITVTRLASANADLASLSLSSGTLSPVFASATGSYTALVSNNTTSITITPTVADAAATIKVNGTAITSGSASGNITLNIGDNPITTIVTAPDGTTTKTYTVTVTRAQSSNADLSNLTLSTGTLSPVFASATNSYSASVGNNVASVTITPTLADATASVSVNGTAVSSGNASGDIALSVGPNIITTTVTAQNGTTTQTYTVTVTRAQSSNANLSSLALSNGTLSPVFSTATGSYTASVANSITSVTLTPITADGTATITVNGTAVASGTASGDINLNVGDNTITTIVTAQDGTSTQTYTITVTRAQSSNADLANLVISSGSLTPTFSAAMVSYATGVSNTTPSITVTPTVDDANATVTINGTPVNSGAASSAITLATGDNTITIEVKAQDGTIKTYTLTVSKSALSNNSLLSNIALSAGTLDPVFLSATNSYTTSVDNGITSIKLTPTVADAAASVTVNGTVVSSGSASGSIGLNVGNNTLTTEVTAENGINVSVYTINVVRAASSNANLAGLGISAGSLSPAFAAGTTSYGVSVGNNITTINLTPAVADATASITVNGDAVTNGNASGNIALNVGPNVITTMVTAEDGTTTQTYTVTVTRALSANADLAGLSLSNGALSPVFSAGTNSYTVSVNNNITDISITPTVADATATISVNGAAVSSGNASGNIGLAVGDNTITTIVTAQDGTTTKTYTIVINRPPSTNANLAGIVLSNGTLSPAFATATNSYTASVSNSTTFITLTPTLSDATASVSVNSNVVASGSASGNINLNVGDNTITTVVTAQDGTTTNTYTIVVNRARSSNADLAGLVISDGTLSPVFASASKNYTVTVSATSVTVTPTVADATATIVVNGNAITSGSPSSGIPLVVGDNAITITVKAQDGTINTYTITVTRLGIPQTITFSPLTPVNYGSADVVAGATSSNNSIPVTYTSSDPAVATITSSGTIHVVGVGSTTITASQSGDSNYNQATPVSQTFTVNRVALNIAADHQSKTYGATNPPLSLTYTGFINGEDATKLTTQPTVTTTATAASAAGSYPITVSGAASTNYTITYTASTITVNQAALTITANSLTKNYGAANPTLTVSYTGFVNGDNATKLSKQPTLSTTAVTASPAGAYPITATGATAINYSITYVAGNLQVNPVALTITATNQARAYGAANPMFAVTYAGFVNGDNATKLTTQPIAGTVATTASNAGTYAITASGATSSNYTITHVNGVLTINKVALNVKADNQSRTYGLPNPALTVTYTGFVTGDDATSLTTQPNVTTTATATSAPGSYTITAIGAVSANYTPTYTAGALTVTPASRIFAFSALPTKTYLDGDFNPGATVNTGETIVYTSNNAAVATIVNGNIHITGAGTANITATVPNNANYTNVTAIVQVLTVNRAAQSISFASVGPLLKESTPTQITVTSTSGLAVSLTSADTYILTVNNNGSGNWAFNPLHIGSALVTALQPGDTNYLPALLTQNVVVKNGDNDPVYVTPALSPNGDGVDDFLLIENISQYPDNKLTIFNRNGIKIYQMAGYDNLNKMFDGHSNVTGSMMQPGSYFYVLEYKTDGQAKKKAGYIILKN